METTKKYLQKSGTVLKSLFSVIATVVLAFALTDAGGMISYYCTSANPFFGFYLQGFALCPVYVTLGLISLITLSSVLLIFLGTLIVDVGKIVGVKTRSRTTTYLKQSIGAKFTCIPVIVKREDKIEIYLSIRNDESWLRFEGVSAELRSFLVRDLIYGHIKWNEHSNESELVSIPHRTHKLLHFATVNLEGDSFSLHKTNGDDTFPIGYFRFLIILQGQVFFWKMRATKVTLDHGLMLIVDYKGKDDISVEIEGLGMAKKMAKIRVQ